MACRIAVLCDNSPDLDRVPSDLSDFCLYGGLYRHVNLVYLPAVALDAVHILPTVGGGRLGAGRSQGEALQSGGGRRRLHGSG